MFWTAVSRDVQMACFGSSLSNPLAQKDEFGRISRFFNFECLMMLC